MSEETKSTGAVADASTGPNTVRVTFLPEGKVVEFEHGKLPYEEHGKEESILDIALNFGVPLDHACGGNCACTTCHVWVKEGAENLSEMDDDEAIVHEFTTQLLKTGTVADNVFDQVKARFHEQGVIDLIGVVGYYCLVSFILNVDRYPVPEGKEPPLSQNP